MPYFYACSLVETVARAFSSLLEKYLTGCGNVYTLNFEDG